jgi:hypothetical protein
LPETTKLAGMGIPAKICESEVVEDFSISEIVDPAFDTDWTGYDLSPKYTRPGGRGEGEAGLPEEAVVVGLESGERARAHPLSVLWYHGIVNDASGGPLIVTYCSLCRTEVVAECRVGGEPMRFGVFGQLWKPPDRYVSASAAAYYAFGADRWYASDVPRVVDAANLVMYDERTRSFWSQAIAEAICGPVTGTRLSIVPSTLASWREWRADHPDTEILLPPPHSSVDLS